MHPSDHIYDYLVIGGGPAGLQLGYYLEQKGRDYVILEGGERPGAFFQRFPRHRLLISTNKVYTGYNDPEVNLRFDWNSLLSHDHTMRFKNYSKDYFPPVQALLDFLDNYVERFGINIRCGIHIATISKGDHFHALDQEGRTWQAKHLIVATGVSKPYIPPIPGIELTENYYDVSIDAKDFANQHVLVIGKGNSGFEIAQHLIPTTALIHIASPSPLKLAWKTHFPGHLRAINNEFLDTYQLKTQNAVLDGTIQKISKTPDGRYQVDIHYTHANEEVETLSYDRVIVCTGFRFDDSIFDESCRPAMWNNGRLPEQTSDYESINVPGLFFAGTLTQMRDYKKSSSSFIHGFRYNARFLHHVLERRYHDATWPSEPVSTTPEALVQAMLERLNKTSALWQLFGYMSDVIVMPDDGTEARYYHELPRDFVQDSNFSDNPSYFVITLEFGKVEDDPFNILRDPDPSKAEFSVFLHPVIRHYKGKELFGEVHLLENLFGEWRDSDQHVKPLLAFVTQQIGEMAKVLG